ncbi:MAG TPA: DUF3857 domain-containing protein [Candidatus Acidoferrum sp.]|nr:DUF3857 domain-containing protein [Candidatus Acidoferrum sp.]
MLLTSLLAMHGAAYGQEGGQNPVGVAEKTVNGKTASSEETPSKPELPFQIQLLETHIRFEVNGDSRKEIHTIVKINNVVGAHQFARLAFDYNRAFQQVEIPLVRISHANGGTSELLPSAVTDAPNPAVEKFPAYQDVRVKSVRILGLEEGDTIEYRVITTTTKHPLAPDFWLEHTFDRSGQVLEEIYELDLPSRESLRVRIDPATPPDSHLPATPAKAERQQYKWTRRAETAKTEENTNTTADIEVTSWKDWFLLAIQLGEHFENHGTSSLELLAKAKSLTSNARTDSEKLEALYEFIGQKIVTVELPLGATGFRLRNAEEILASGYATEEDKFLLLAELGSLNGLVIFPVLFHSEHGIEKSLPQPGLLTKLVDVAQLGQKQVWMDPSSGVTPFGFLAANVRGRKGLRPGAFDTDFMYWNRAPLELPFAAFQHVTVKGLLQPDGGLSARVQYTLRGDNELLLRVAFQQTAKEKWKDVAGLLALSDGFRGQVTSVEVSDPLATKDPFTVEYEITQPKFVAWSKKPVRIPALLPQIGLPDPPTKPAAGEAAHAIELGTPLDVDAQMTLKLPPGTVVQAPAGTSVERDYAKFTSKYGATANTVTASRRVNFLLREIPGERAMDYNAFVRAVQSDQAQMITLAPAVAAEATPGEAAPKP